MEDAIVAMLNALSQGAGGDTSALLQSPDQYNAALYNAAATIHNVAVKPVTSIVLSIMFVLMLASTSTHVEGDRELGVRVVAATMFKAALVLVAAQNATLILDAISSIATSIAGAANGIDMGSAGGDGQMLGDTLKDKIKDAGMIKQLGMMVILLLPFIVAKVMSVLAIVLIFVRFLQMYMLSAFASLPIAFFGHDDTRQMGIGYLKKFASIALQGVMIIVACKMYQALLGGWLGNQVHADENTDMWQFTVNNFGNFIVAPVVLGFLLIGANGLAKSLVGEG